MKKLALICLLSVLAVPASPQKRSPPGNRDLAQYEKAHPLEPPANFPTRVDPLELQRQARELSTLAQSIPGDVDQVAKGVLPKDVVGKLKQIEKLSKSLRSKLTD